MKNTLFIGMLCIAIASLTSCSKDYECTTKTTSTVIGGTSITTTEVRMYKEISKSDAEDIELQNTYTTSTAEYTTTCEEM
ncbi:MAG: hypothetical protein GY827_10980 [Cytophagales bacterium]|nr:hypothetical protein [Cytophagales bacterium]